MLADALNLEGKVAMVTGASRGLGKAIALALAEAGADVAATARSVKDNEETASQVCALGRRALALPLDVRETDQVERTVERVVKELGRIDILVNNSGIGPVGRFVEQNDDVWHQILETNVTGVFRCTRAAGKYMIAQGSGKVINVASAGGIQGKAGLVAYCSSKAAVILFTKSLAAEWARHNIQVNAIAPGAFNTAPQAAVFGDETLAKKRVQSIPARRPGQPEEIGPLAAFLASKASDYITGAVMVIDGGESAKI